MAVSARHTSAALSRRLRAAGMEQDVTPAANHYHESMGRIAAENDLCIDEECWQFRNCCRALRLDEVLGELTREREGGPLALHVGVNVHSTITAVEAENDRTGPGAQGYARHAETVEAAGLVLAQLLEARQ